VRRVFGERGVTDGVWSPLRSGCAESPDYR
jgi:hypothetical protein